MTIPFDELPASPSVRSAAYKVLGVTPEDVFRTPRITPQLQEISRALRLRGPGLRNAETPGAYLLKTWPHYLRASDDSDARKVLDAYDALYPAGLRKHLPIEAFCLAAGVPPTKILGVLTAVCVAHGANAVVMLTALQKPDVVQSTIRRALDDAHPEALHYTAMFHKATGFLPTPKGSTTTVNVQSNANAVAAAQSTAGPPPEATIRRMVDRFNDQRTLDARPAPPQLEAEVTVAMPVPARVQPDAVAVEAEYEGEDDEHE